MFPKVFIRIFRAPKRSGDYLACGIRGGIFSNSSCVPNIGIVTSFPGDSERSTQVSGRHVVRLAGSYDLCPNRKGVCRWVVPVSKGSLWDHFLSFCSPLYRRSRI